MKIKQYFKDKPYKCGINVFAVCEARTGIMLGFVVYKGKEDHGAVSGNGVAYDVVMKLIERFNDGGHHAFFDNWYSTPRLFTDRWTKLKMLATGTIRTNRKGYCPDIKTSEKDAKKLERGHYKAS